MIASTASGADAARPPLATTSSNRSVTTSSGAPKDTARPPSAPTPAVTSGPASCRHVTSSSAASSVTATASSVTTPPASTTRSGPASATASTGAGNVVVVGDVVVDDVVVIAGSVVAMPAVVGVVPSVTSVGSPDRDTRNATPPMSSTMADATANPISALRWRRCAGSGSPALRVGSPRRAPWSGGRCAGSGSTAPFHSDIAHHLWAGTVLNGQRGGRSHAGPGPVRRVAGAASRAT